MAEVRGMSTYQTYLMIGPEYSAESHTDVSTFAAAGTYKKLIDIVTFPDMVGNVENIDITTLSDGQNCYVPGIASIDDMQFEANYTAENFKAVEAYHDQTKAYCMAVWFGVDASGNPDGHMGQFYFGGYIRPGVSGGGVNEKITMTVNVVPTTETFFTSTAATSGT